MLIATKTTLMLTATTVLVVGLYGFNLLRDEERQLGESIERETRLLGSAVQASVGNALRDDQMADVGRALADLEALDPSMDVYIFDAQGALVAQSENNPPAARFVPSAMKAMHDQQPVLIRDPLDAEHPKSVLALPVAVGDAGSVHGLVVVRSLEAMRRSLADTERGVLGSMGLLVLAIALIQYVLGTRYVTRPLDTLTAAMKTLRSGATVSSPSSNRSDEVGHVIQEFGYLVEDLRAARERIDREVESRMTLEHGLQRVDKMITIGQLSAGLAHEIGSPLQVLSGRARAILARPHNHEDVLRHAHILAEQSDRITRIVAQLLDYSRRRPPKFALTDIRVPVRSVLELIAFTAQRRDVSVEMRSEEDLPALVIDSDQIQQLVLNLLNNALEASPRSGHVSVRLSRCSIDGLAGGDAAPGIKITIEDDGRGIPKDMLERLFQPFFTTRASEGGTGLGLAVVKAIVVEHAGRISAFSEVGRGSRFEIELPLNGPGLAGINAGAINAGVNA